jgi:hypothetical protein
MAQVIESAYRSMIENDWAPALNRVEQETE